MWRYIWGGDYEVGAFNEIPPAVGGDLSVSSLLNMGVNFITFVAFAVSFLATVYSSVLFITSGGDVKQASKAKKALTWSILGMLLAASVLGIKAVLMSLFGAGDLPA